MPRPSELSLFLQGDGFVFLFFVFLIQSTRHHHLRKSHKIQVEIPMLVCGVLYRGGVRRERFHSRHTYVHVSVENSLAWRIILLAWEDDERGCRSTNAERRGDGVHLIIEKSCIHRPYSLLLNCMDRICKERFREPRTSTLTAGKMKNDAGFMAPGLEHA